jgi:hypothetical protein
MSKIWNHDHSDFMIRGKFNANQFNKSFEHSKDNAKLLKKFNQQIRINELNRNNNTLSLHTQNIKDIMINTKNSWFNIMDDILTYNIDKDTIIKDNRLFYIGLTVLIIGIILYVFHIDSDELKI